MKELKVLKFINDGISLYKSYLEANSLRLEKTLTDKPLEDLEPDGLYEVVRMVSADNYYNGQVDALQNLKVYFESLYNISEEGLDAQTDNTKYL